MVLPNTGPERAWAALWSDWWETVDQIHGGVGDPWGPEELAVFLDVTAMAIRELIPAIENTAIAEQFDLLEEVRKTARRGLAEIEKQTGPLEDRRLPLEPYTMEMILMWELMNFTNEPDRKMAFSDRIRVIREESPELLMDNEVIVRFICRLAGFPVRP